MIRPRRTLVAAGSCRIMGRMESQIIRPGYLTAHQAASVLGVTLTGLRSIVHRGQLARVSGTPRQPWYAVADVTTLAAQRAERAAA